MASKKDKQPLLDCDARIKGTNQCQVYADC